jgi:uncharacterized protein (DUF885 family)
VTDYADSPVNALAERMWEAYLALAPSLATMYGDERYADRLEDPGPEGRAERRALFEAALAGAEAIDEATVDEEEDRITLHVAKVLSRRSILEDDQRVDLLFAAHHMDGPQTQLPQVVGFQPADTPERLEKLLARLRAYGPYLDAYVGLLREGIATGLTVPRVVAERAIDQLERLQATPLAEAVIPAVARVASDADRELVREVVRDVVYPAQAAYLDVLRHEYLPRTRTEPGLWSAPHGEAIYRTLIHTWTTLSLEPEAVHAIGLEEMAAIDEQRRAIAAAAGYGDDVAAYRRTLQADPTNRPATPDDLLERAREDIDRAMALAPRYFSRLPRAGCTVMATEQFKEKDTPFAYYFPPTIDGSRPGTYYVNTYDLPSRFFSSLASTTFHEAVPGHHFQIALEMENPDLIPFRRLAARAAAGAFVEGWGLYAEALADELGLYRNDGERLGMLDARAWRAARLVVDSGLHALRWTRQQSIDYLLGSGLTETDAVIETDRYISTPGQALAYMIGMREIVRLRREMEARDGDRFDIRGFHDAVLGHGSLPLGTLAAELPRWVTPRG